MHHAALKLLVGNVILQYKCLLLNLCSFELYKHSDLEYLIGKGSEIVPRAKIRVWQLHIELREFVTFIQHKIRKGAIRIGGTWDDTKFPHRAPANFFLNGDIKFDQFPPSGSQAETRRRTDGRVDMTSPTCAQFMTPSNERTTLESDRDTIQYP